MTVKSLKEFTSPVLGNVWIGRVCVVDKDLGKKLIAGGWVKQDDGKAEQAAAAKEIVASDAAKKLAEENGVDIAIITGTGKDGGITLPDVKKYLEENPTKEVTATEEAIKLAEENGVDISLVVATGDDGVITLEDVQLHIDNQV